jgi:polycystin 1L2
MRGSLSFIKGNISILQQMGWIDRQTRAIFVEFSTYNPNINMLIVAELLIEILPTGTIITLARFDPLNLFNELNNNSGVTLKIIIYLCYILFIAYFIFAEIREMFKSGLRSYCTKFWNYVEWAMIALSLVAFALFFYRLSQAYSVLDFFEKTQGYGYKKLQIVSYWNQMLTISLAACCVFATLRFLKLFR